jgi:putative DNA-binding protein
VHGLVELQRSFARAMTSGDGAALGGRLRGGRDPGERLAIHLRHYAASLAAALCDKFPASSWLVGAAAMREAAGAYARLRPPLQPCVAEYGRDFPQFLARHPRTACVPYVRSFAELEWAVVQASIAIDAPPLSWTELAAGGAERLVDARLVLQTGVHYVRADWRIDELMQTYSSGAAPDRFVLMNADTPIEARGARGAFTLVRLDAATFAFRTALAAGRTVGEAADTALVLDQGFDAGRALRALVDAELVTAGATATQEPVR